MLELSVDIKEKNRRIGARIRTAREAKGWSQFKLADKLDTKQATVARWEAGSFPKRFGLPKIAKALEKTVEWLQEIGGAEIDQLESRLKVLEQKNHAPRGEPMTPEESELLGLYRRAIGRGKLASDILRQVRAMVSDDCESGASHKSGD